MKRLFSKALPLALLAAAFAASPEAGAQDTTAEDIEALFSAEEESAANAPPPKEKAQDKVESPAPADKPAASADIKDLSDLVKLSPFEDVAVIQKRYLPKTKRFELSAGLSGVLNDAFFLSVGGVGRMGYYFQERFGVEFNAWILGTSEKQITSDLRGKRGVYTQSLITPESFYGLDFKWIPVYGKMARNNKTITPFDLYFSVGGGLTGTNQGGSEPTLHLGTGQVFALSKSHAFRWDFSWNFFAAESPLAARKETSIYNNLFLTVGMSWFFPEAAYR